MSFGNKLKYLRKKNDLTQAELAKYLEVTRSTVASYETRNKQPDYEKLIEIADCFQVSIDYLLTGSDNSITIMPNKTYSEKSLDYYILTNYRHLSLASKHDLMNYLQLLEIRDKSVETL